MKNRSTITDTLVKEKVYDNKLKIMLPFCLHIYYIPLVAKASLPALPNICNGMKSSFNARMLYVLKKRLTSF